MMFAATLLSLSLNVLVADAPAKAIAPTTNNDLVKPLANSAKEELQIVDRLRSIRVAVEKLPEAWQATGLKSLPAGTVLTKKMLIEEIENLELAAADRWMVLLQNTAEIDQSDSFAAEARDGLNQIPKIHQEFNRKLDDLNAKMKDGILLNLASRVMPQN